MIYEVLNKSNVEKYIDYLRIAMAEDANMMTAESLDEQGIRNRILDPFYNQTTSILAMENGKKVFERVVKGENLWQIEQ